MKTGKSSISWALQIRYPNFLLLRRATQFTLIIDRTEIWVYLLLELVESVFFPILKTILNSESGTCSSKCNQKALQYLHFLLDEILVISICNLHILLVSLPHKSGGYLQVVLSKKIKTWKIDQCYIPTSLY